MLEDVDLAALGPAGAVFRQHPDGRPGTPGARQLGPRLDKAVAEARLALRDDLRRAVLLPAPVGQGADRVRVLVRLDDQAPALQAPVPAPLSGIILQLAIVPSLLVA